MRVHAAVGFAAVVCWPGLVLADAMPPLIPIASFVKAGQYDNPRLSPDGKHLAVTVRTPVGKRTIPMVTFYSLPELKLESVVRMPLFSVPVDYQWVSNTRLIVQKGMEVGTRERPQLTGEILAMDYDGTHQEYLFGWDMLTYSSRGSRYGRDEGYAFPADGISLRNDHLMLATYQWDHEKSTLYDVDTRSALRRLVSTVGTPNASFIIDNSGKPRFATGSDQQNYYSLWRLDDKTGSWEAVTSEKKERVIPFGFSTDDSQVFSWYAESGGPSKVMRQNMATGERKVLAEDAHGDIDLLMMGARHTTPVAVISSAGRPRVTYLDDSSPDMLLHQDLSRQFPDHIVVLSSETDDGSKVMFWLHSDRDPGAYFMYDRKTNKADMLFAAMEDIEPNDMAVRRPVSFKARDGLRIDGYLTLPKFKTAVKPPLILIPHGGPAGADSWYFDPDAQFLANRGYAVLQVNFRGSSGRGYKFERSGYREWGGKIMDDLVDGVKWTVAQGDVDGSKMCVFGASFGGYSALMLAAREPDLFKCAVGYAGVYDIALLQTEDGIAGNSRRTAYHQRMFGEDQAEWARYSPTLHADSIKAGVLLIHGGHDKRAPKEHAFMMKQALEKAGHAPEWYYVDYEGHGFYDTENQAEVYRRLEAFFAQYLGKPRG